MANSCRYWLRDYSRFPAGRTPKDGPANGQTFREEVLRPLLLKNGNVTLVLDGVAGLPSSFLEEVFGGLVRRGILKPEDVSSRFKIETSEPALRVYIPLAFKYAKDAARGHA